MQRVTLALLSVTRHYGANGRRVSVVRPPNLKQVGGFSACQGR